MDRLTSKQLKQLLNFLRGSYACHDQEAFVTHLVQGIATVIRSDASAYTEIDLRRWRVLEASRIEPSDIEFSGTRQIFAQRISEYPIATYYQRTRDGACLLVRHLCEATQCLLLLEERQTARAPASFERDGLTRREAEVLQWVTQGKTNIEIGCILGMSPATVKKHLQHIFEKLGVETRTAAAALVLGWRSEG